MAASPAEIRGKYIVLEGGEGTGKSTQAARLAVSIGARLTRETGGTAIGQRIRTILHDTTVENLSPKAEALLVAGDRAQHIDEIVRPALITGRHVVSDRFWWSTVAYQGFGRNLDVAEILALTEFATGDCFNPDLVFLLVAGKASLKERMRGRKLDRFEQEGDDYHELVDTGYEYLMGTYKDLGVLVDTEQGIERVARQIRTTCRERLEI